MHPLHEQSITGKVYEDSRWICFDFETTNKQKGFAFDPENYVVMVAWCEGKGDKVGKVKHHYGPLLQAKHFWDALERATYCVAHNAKFEVEWLLRSGYNEACKRVWFDSLLAEWVLLGNNPRHARLGLDYVAARYKERTKDSIVDALMSSEVCPSEIPEHRLIDRCRDDVHATARIHRKQVARLRKRGLLACAAQRACTMAVLGAIESEGLQLDAERVRSVWKEYYRTYTRLEEEFNKITRGVNFRSPKQMATFLYGVKPLDWDDEQEVYSLNFKEICRHGKPIRNKANKNFPEGVPKTDKSTLGALASQARTKRQKRFFELRAELGQVAAALSKNLDFFLGVVEERDCHFFVELRQGVAGTHRLVGRGRPQQFVRFASTKSVQPQNMPRIFKSLFCSPEKDWYATAADGAQLEFRVAAYWGQDQQAMKDLRDPDFDAHMQTVTIMHDEYFDGTLNRDLYNQYRDAYLAGDKTLKAWRQEAKGHTFKPLYGGESGTEQEVRYYEWFRNHYSGVTERGYQSLNEVESTDRTGRLTTATGMQFWWDYTYRNDIAIIKSTGKPLKPAAFNYPVQYLATGEIIPITLCCLYHKAVRDNLKVKFTNTVHDDIWALVHKDDIEAYHGLVREAFTTDVYKYLKIAYNIDYNVPLGYELTYGTHLGEGETFAGVIEPKELA